MRKTERNKAARKREKKRRARKKKIDVNTKINSERQKIFCQIQRKTYKDKMKDRRDRERQKKQKRRKTIELNTKRKVYKDLRN